MAYSQANSYEAPRRAHYDQHQQAPVQRQHGGYPPQQQYDGYDQSYDQGYGQHAQHHAGYDDYGYDMNQQSAQYYGDNGPGNGYGHEQYDQGYSQQHHGQQGYRQEGHPQQQNGYARPNEAYANGHHEAYSTQDRHYDPRGQQRPVRGGHVQQPNGHGYAGDAYAGGNYGDTGMQDRQYDPRYQQRPDRGGHLPSNSSRSQRPPPVSNQSHSDGARSQRQPPPSDQDYRGQPPQPRGHDPRNGPPQQRPGHQGQPTERIHQDSRNGFREQRDVRDRPEKQPSPPHSNGGSRQGQPPPQEPKKSAMEEWKAKEKARMYEAANRPKMIPQDNAFPTIATKKEGKEAGGREGRSTRSSEDQTRPSTSGGRNESRPGTSRNNSQQQTSPPPAARGQQHHQPRAPQNFAPVHEQSGQGHSDQLPQQRGDYGRDQQNSVPPRRPLPPRTDSVPQSHGERNLPSNNRMPPQSASGQQPHHQGRPDERQRVVSPPQANVPYTQPQPPPQPTPAPVVEPPRANVPEPQSEPETAVDPDEYYPQESWRTGPPRKRPLADRAPKAAPVPKADPAPKVETVAPQESWRTGPSSTIAQDQIMARQPEAIPPPAVRPPQSRPAVAHQESSRVLSPTSQQPRSGVQPTPKNFARPNAVPVAPAYEENPDDSYDDLYDDYYGAEQPPAVSVPMPPQNREEEIEAEMPDFDSAAPGQTSGVHKRQQEKPAQLPVMPSQHVNASVQSLPVQRHQPYEHHQEIAVTSQPDFRDMRHDQGGAADGFVFGVPGEQVRGQQQYEDPRQMQPRQQPMAYRPVQSVPPENMRRFQSPFDQRQIDMPMHGGPPGDYPQAQRFPPGGRGPIPPQQRSASTRPPIAQTGWSDPGVQRAPTAPPPMRQDSYGAPHNGVPHNGMPRNGSLTNQQHRAPSAPPGQQHMRGMPLPGMPRNGPPFGQQQAMRPPMQEQRLSDPDSLPHHPAPYRPGLMEQGAPQPAKPAPVRNYDNRSSTSSHQRQVSIPDGPITQADLEQARLDVEANKASPRLALRYAKKLVEASHVLASEGGRLDAKTTQRNREKYLNEAYKRVKELVRNTYPEAQFYMAECYGSGEMGLQIDAKEAFSLYQAAAKGGHAAAAFRTAVSCEIGPEEGGGTRKDYPKAVQWYRRAAALGDVAAMYKLGIVLLRGLLGGPRNVGEAVSWLKRAAERADKDNPHALHELATLHEPTNPDPQVREKIIPDEAYALSLFKQAAELGFKRSQFRLGQAYEYGSLGLDIDNRASIAWYTKAAAQGEHQAELALSGWYLTGAEGMLEQSDMEAYLWARKAAQSEPPLAKAMFAMGYFTEQGIGCPKSLEEAKRWYGRAASFQFPQAVARLEELRKGGKSKQQGKLTRDKKKDDENCVVM